MLLRVFPSLLIPFLAFVLKSIWATSFSSLLYNCLHFNKVCETGRPSPPRVRTSCQDTNHKKEFQDLSKSFGGGLWQMQTSTFQSSAQQFSTLKSRTSWEELILCEIMGHFYVAPLKAWARSAGGTLLFGPKQKWKCCYDSTVCLWGTLWWAGLQKCCGHRSSMASMLGNE